jgi:hypothetical protein
MLFKKNSIINLIKNEIYHEFKSETDEKAFIKAILYDNNNKYYLFSSSMHAEINF